MNPENIQFRIFPQPHVILDARKANNDTATAFQDLVTEARKSIESWKDPKNRCFSLLESANTRAAELLIDALRENGYAADFHWHGSRQCNDTTEKVCIQFAFHENDLSRAHHDPRR